MSKNISRKRKEPLNRRFQRSVSEGELKRALGEIRKNCAALEDSTANSRHIYSVSPDDLIKEVRVTGLQHLSSSEVIGLILVLLSKPTELNWLVFDDLGQLAKKHRYEGQWMLVHHLLKLRNLELALYHLIERGTSLRTVFGNILANGVRAFKKVKVFVGKYRGPVKQPQRKRGYDDHGSRRPEDRWLPTDIHLGPNPESLDLSRLYPGESVKRKILNFLYA